MITTRPLSFDELDRVLSRGFGYCLHRNKHQWPYLYQVIGIDGVVLDHRGGPVERATLGEIEEWIADEVAWSWLRHCKPYRDGAPRPERLRTANVR